MLMFCVSSSTENKTKDSAIITEDSMIKLRDSILAGERTRGKKKNHLHLPHAHSLLKYFRPHLLDTGEIIFLELQTPAFIELRRIELDKGRNRVLRDRKVRGRQSHSAVQGISGEES